MILRPSRPADRSAVRAVVRAAFGEEGASVDSMLDALDASGATAASLVAEDEEGELIGHVQLSRCWVDARERLVDVLVLSPLSVRPDRQGAGIGTALVAAAVRAATASGAPAVFLEGSPDYYRARGFDPGADHGFVRPSVRIPEAAFQVAVLPAHEPWMTGALVYCEAFWATDSVGLRDPLLARLEKG
ncbi:MAG: N-acetyltransferase [Pseudonocardia sp.]|nr:N-acetyltransferase [Pseudonocardia sp.]